MSKRWYAVCCWLLGLALLAGVAAGGPARAAQPSAASPVLSALSPASFANGVNLPVTITGSGLDTVVSATLGAVALRNVAVISSTQVTALVPWSIAAGTDDLTVTDAGGHSASLPAAATVSAGSSDWTSGGPYGGELYDVALDPAVTSTAALPGARLFVAAYRSGLFQSQDGGAHWNFSLVTPFPDQVQFTYPTPGQPPVLYLGGDAGLGMVRSEDDGQTWQPKVPGAFTIMQSSGGAAVRAFVRPSEPSSVYLGFDSRRSPTDPLGGLYKSPDLGESWGLVTGTSGLHVSALAFDPDQPAAMVLGTTDGDENNQATTGQVLTTANNGLTWSQPLTLSNKIGRLSFAPTLYNGHRGLFATPCNPEGCHDLSDAAFASLDGGQTWITLTVAPTDPGPNENGLVYDLAFHDTIPGLMWAAAGDGYYSEDGGATWNPVGAGLYQVHGLAVVPGALTRQTTTLFAATAGGLYQSTDGGDTWRETDAGLGAVLARSIAISPFNADEAYAATQVKGLLHTVDGGRHWQSLTIPIGGYDVALAADPFTDGRLYVGDADISSDSLVVRVSSDHGGSFITHPLTLPAPYTGHAADVFSLAPDPEIHNRLLAGVCLGYQAGSPGFIYASTDGGSTWLPQTTPAGILCVAQLTFDPNHPDVVYAGVNGTGLLRSVDRGATWTLMPHQATQFATDGFQSVVIDPRDSNSIYLCAFDASNTGHGGIYATHDGGLNWVKMTGSHMPIWALKFVPVGQGYWLYAATMDGLQYLKTIPANPAAPWLTVSGIAGVATVDGFNAAAEPGRIVYYIGTSGGTPLSRALAGPARANSSPILAGGIYRRLDRINRLYLPALGRP